MGDFQLDANTVNYSELMGRAVREFKAGWKEADAENLYGSRVERGLERVFEVLGIVLFNSLRLVTAPEHQRCLEVEGGGQRCRHWANTDHDHEVEYTMWSGEEPKEPITFLVGRIPVPEGVEFR